MYCRRNVSDGFNDVVFDLSLHPGFNDIILLLLLQLFIVFIPHCIMYILTCYVYIKPLMTLHNAYNDIT